MLGISPAVGILYVDGLWDKIFPSLFHDTSSIVNQPRPWTKPPSIWPISILSFIEFPTSWIISTCNNLFSPVNVSIITSLTAAP